MMRRGYIITRVEGGFLLGGSAVYLTLLALGS